VARRVEDLFYVSRDDYLAAERSATTKSEWVDGTVYAMAGASRDHVAAVSRMMGLLVGPAQRRGCFIAAADMLVATAHANYYPDVFVSCDPGDDRYVEHRPCFIAEVLSPSTNRVDRIEKRVAYLAIESMRTYWIVDADTKVIEAWVRTEEGWRGSHHTAGEPLEIACLDLTVRVVDVVGA
jgi:Uma2 family endonuclease